jgi:hypothetical protein
MPAPRSSCTTRSGSMPSGSTAHVLRRGPTTALAHAELVVLGTGGAVPRTRPASLGPAVGARSSMPAALDPEAWRNAGPTGRWADQRRTDPTRLKVRALLTWFVVGSATVPIGTHSTWPSTFRPAAGASCPSIPEQRSHGEQGHNRRRSRDLSAVLTSSTSSPGPTAQGRRHQAIDAGRGRLVPDGRDRRRGGGAGGGRRTRHDHGSPPRELRR